MSGDNWPNFAEAVPLDGQLAWTAIYNRSQSFDDERGHWVSVLNYQVTLWNGGERMRSFVAECEVPEAAGPVAVCEALGHAVEHALAVDLTRGLDFDWPSFSEPILLDGQLACTAVFDRLDDRFNYRRQSWMVHYKVTLCNGCRKVRNFWLAWESKPGDGPGFHQRVRQELSQAVTRDRMGESGREWPQFREIVPKNERFGWTAEFDCFDPPNELYYEVTYWDRGRRLENRYLTKVRMSWPDDGHVLGDWLRRQLTDQPLPFDPPPDLARRKAVEALWERMLREGGTCTHCGISGKAVTGFRLSQGSEDLVICRKCGWPQAVVIEVT